MKTAGAFPSSPLWFDSTLHFGLIPVASGLLLEMSSPAAGVKGSQDRGTSLPFSCVTGYDRVFSFNKRACMEVVALKPGGSSSTINASGQRKQSFVPFFFKFTFTERKDQQDTGGCHGQGLDLLGTLITPLQKLMQ